MYNTEEIHETIRMIRDQNLDIRTVTMGISLYDCVSEDADRLCAKAGSKDYGAITAVLAYYGEAEELFTVRADRFVPAPKVDSAVVVFLPLPEEKKLDKKELLAQIEALKAEAKEKDDKYLRMAAEYDNFRRRSREEREAGEDDED